MKLSLNWLKEYIKIKQTPEQLAEVLTLAGLEVESVEKLGKGLDQIIVGQIKTMVDHAEADKLRVCKVDIGASQLLNIVCGASNIKAGDKVPVVLVGATLPNGVKIEARRIRGVDSEGMLCAEDELGLGDDHEGIMILDKDLRVGQKLGKAIGLDDTVFDLALTPNRADWFSVLGLARELSAILKLKLSVKTYPMMEDAKTNAKKLLKVQVNDYNLCPKYVARVVSNVKIGESPAWLKSRLIVSGMKPINNVVDITNYVMLELGQPLHAFDYDKIGGHKIIIRRAKAGEKMVTLDDEDRKLENTMLVIADNKKPVAIAGVMGGFDSEVTKLTKNVVIESAIFKPISIRKTRQKLNVVTEASMRFEKGIWWTLPEQAADRAAALMSQLAGAEVVKDKIICQTKKVPSQKTIKVSLDYINKIIGLTFKIKQVKDILEGLRFKVQAPKDNILYVNPPSFRPDVKLQADVAEEVGRLYGWNNIEPAPIYAELKPVALSAEKYREREIKELLAAACLTEVLNYSFYSKNLMDKFSFQEKDHYRLINPLNPEQAYLRISLLPRLIENVSQNAPDYETIKLFEMGHVYKKSRKELPEENQYLAALIFGKKYEFYRLKGVLNKLFDHLKIKDVEYRRADNQVMTGAEIFIKNQRIGYLGNVNLMISEKSKILGKISAFELDFHKLIQFGGRTSYKPVSEFPSVERDLALAVDNKVTYADLFEEINNFSPLIVSVEGFDLYVMPDGRKSMAFHLVFQAPNRTLKSEEVDEIQQQIIENLNKKFKAVLRK